MKRKILTDLLVMAAAAAIIVFLLLCYYAKSLQALRPVALGVLVFLAYLGAERPFIALLKKRGRPTPTALN